MAITIVDGFSDMDDPRLDRKKLYPLIEIIFLTIAAVVSGADHFTDIQMFGQVNLAWLRKFLPYANGIPSHDAIGYFFSKLDPEEFKTRFIEWIQSVATVSDGNTLRRSHNAAANKQAIHMISGCIVTIDAMGCQKEIARTIIDKKADYVLAVKGNQYHRPNHHLRPALLHH